MTYDQLVSRGKHVVIVIRQSIMADMLSNTECFYHRYDELSTLAHDYFGVEATKFAKDTGYYTKED